MHIYLKGCLTISWNCLVLCTATADRSIDEVYYLQRYKEGWTDGKWDEKMDERECIEQNSFVQVILFYVCAVLMLFTNIQFSST